MGRAARNGDFVAASNDRVAAMPQPNEPGQDPSSPWTRIARSLRSSSLATRAGVLAVCFPGLSVEPRKKLEPSPERLLALLHRGQDEAVRAGRQSRGLHLPSKPAAMGFGWHAGVGQSGQPLEGALILP